MKRGSTDVPAAERRLFFFRIRPICPLPESVYFAHSTLAAAILLPTLGIATYAPFRRLSRQQCRKRDSTSAMLRVDVGATICSDSRQASCLTAPSPFFTNRANTLFVPFSFFRHQPAAYPPQAFLFLPCRMEFDLHAIDTHCLPTCSQKPGTVEHQRIVYHDQCRSWVSICD